MPSLKFTVDAALLRELGQRLVGRPHIALAELVKNGYDADATQVTIEFEPDNDSIVVQDDGHGMTFEEFRDFWMRVGTTHKVDDRLSRHYHRNMTGSKGVGRLSAQFLTNRLHIVTVPEDGDNWLEADVDWQEAVTAGSLTEAEVSYDIRQGGKPFRHGTCMSMSELRHEWMDSDIVKALAAELWWLQPPFRVTSPVDGRGDPGLRIRFHSSEPDFESTFQRQMQAILKIWTARIVGRNRMGEVSLSLEFAGEAPRSYEYRVADFRHNRERPQNEQGFRRKRNLNGGTFEIRVFTLKYRQPSGIRVSEARDYFEKYGGVHVYDGGFRLPYYGLARNDWLRIQFDQAQRRTLSELLPDEIQTAFRDTERLSFLPTLGRVFGVVRVDTSSEPNLEIMITRDRLAETDAYRDLVGVVRYALDLYAYEEARRHYEETRRGSSIAPLETRVDDMATALHEVRETIPRPAFEKLRSTWERVEPAITADRDRIASQLALLGPLATAGIANLALRHESRKQFSAIEEIIERLEGITSRRTVPRAEIQALTEDLSNWLRRARGIDEVFGYLLDAENTKERARFETSVLVDQILRQTAALARGMQTRTCRIERGTLLPKASYAEWGSILQNVFINAFNAMIDQETRILDVSTRRRGSEHELLIQDTGTGVDLGNAEKLFEPFERGAKITPERMAMGYGGSGLGLTIVRLLAERIGCTARFVRPEDGFATAFSIGWRETNAHG